MNNEAGSSGTQRPPIDASTLRPGENEGEEDHDRAQGGTGLSPQDQKARAGLKRLKLLDDFENQLDSLALVEIAMVYYLDCSFVRFVLRGLIQFCYLTPLPLVFPERPDRQPYVSAIIGSNILCTLFHIWNTAPSSSEALRGYLHGGMAMDFIGTKGPVSKLHLVLLDVTILALQLILLSANVKRRILRERLKQPRPARSENDSVDAAATEPVNPETNQDIDAEEQGLLRRSMSFGSAYGTQNIDTLQESTLESEPRRLPNSILDALSSGQAVIVELRIAETVREQFQLYQERYSSSSAPADFATQLAGRSMRLTRFRLNAAG